MCVCLCISITVLDCLSREILLDVHMVVVVPVVSFVLLTPHRIEFYSRHSLFTCNYVTCKYVTCNYAV